MGGAPTPKWDPFGFDPQSCVASHGHSAPWIAKIRSNLARHDSLEMHGRAHRDQIQQSLAVFGSLGTLLPIQTSDTALRLGGCYP